MSDQDDHARLGPVTRFLPQSAGAVRLAVGNPVAAQDPGACREDGKIIGKIIERVQQADVLGQMRQLYGKALGLVGLDAMFLRL